MADFKLKIATLNVRGLRNNIKRKSVLRWAKDHKIDILCLQETYCTDELVNTFNKDWNGKVFHTTSNSPHSRGVTTLISKKLDFEFLNSNKSNDGRKLLINCKINGITYTIVNVYLPNEVKAKKQYLKSLPKWIREHALDDNHLYVCGDMNTAAQVIDKTNNVTDRAAKQLADFKKLSELHDVWREMNPLSREYTWVDPADVSHKSRIDYIWISSYLTDYVVKCTIINAPVPDHLAVIVDLKKTNRQRGPSYWKLNTSVLTEKEYCTGLTNIWESTVAEYSEILCKRQLWDFCKIRIKEYSIRYCISRKRRLVNSYKGIEEELRSLDSQIDLDLENTELLKQKRSHKKKELDEMSQNKAMGYQIRSRAKWIEDGEKSSAYFSRLENFRQTNSVIEELECKSGSTVHSDEDILMEASQFYSELYSSQKPAAEDIDTYMNNIHFPRTLTEVQRDLCEGIITKQDCENVINNIKKNRSPGLDGLPIEFYLAFWPLIGDFLVDVYNEAYAEGQLCESQKKSALSLIFKKNNKKLLKNYRPISLATTDYKILAFVLSERIRPVLGSIISESQSGYVKKRFIGQNIRLVEDILDYSNKHNKSGAIVFLDFQKAFDTVEWNFLWKTLERFNFGPSFMQWIKILYKNPVAVIKNNGWVSENIKLERGIRQGCPISALLFILVVEVLSLDIKNNIEGYKINTSKGVKRVQIMQYADDAMLFFDDLNEIEKALEIINKFSTVAGTKLNMEKTEALYLGPNSEDVDYVSGIKCTKDVVRCLGIYVGHNQKLCNKLNWDDKLTNMEKTIQMWKQRDLTLFGKIAIIKTLALPKLIFSATNLTHDQTVVKEINRILYNFIWNKKDRIKRKTLIGPIKQGGLNMIDVESQFKALKAAWMARIMNAEECEWNFLAKEYFVRFGPNNLLHKMKFKPENMLEQIKIIPPFYQQIIEGFMASKSNEMPDSDDVLNEEIIWGNECFTLTKNRRKNSLLFANWISSGIIHVKDLKYKDGIIDQQYLTQKIRNKANFYVEFLSIQKVLKPYKHLMKENQPSEHIIQDNDVNDVKSRHFYTRLRDIKFHPPDITKWNRLTGTADGQIRNDVYMRQVKNIPEKKIAEFNYKVLNRILPCGQLVCKWDNTVSEKCTQCNVVEDISHLLFHCSIAKPIWRIIAEAFNIDICLSDIVFGVDNQYENYVISLTAFSIYKYWIICQKRKTQRCTEGMKHLIESDLIFRQNVWVHLGRIKYVQRIGKCLSLL